MPYAYWFAVWVGAAAVIGAAWIVRLAAMSRAIRHRKVLSAHTYLGPPDPPPRVCVLVAARNEQDHIETCLTSLLGQDYPDFEVIAVDDRSSDATPQILRCLLGAHADRLTVITIETLPEGWTGKSHALAEGVKVASGDWLCFTDADCRQISARTLTMAVRDATLYNADLMTLTPVIEMRSIWEKGIQPVCAMTLMAWFRPRHANNPKQTTAYANGAFMLVRRGCYEAIGGHARVSGAINEDIQLARCAKDAGYRLRVVENDDLYRTIMYTSIVDAWRGWSRIFCALPSPWHVAVAMASILLFAMAPWVSLITAVIGRTGAAPENTLSWNAALFAWAAVVVLMQFMAWRFYGLLKVNRFWSLAYVIGATATCMVLGNTLLKVTGLSRTTWRGTTYGGGTKWVSDPEAWSPALEEGESKTESKMGQENR